MRIRVVPLNDGEAHEIVKLLLQTGERVLVSEQRWGASWNGLEPGSKNELESFRSEHPDGEIIGVELAGLEFVWRSRPREGCEADHRDAEPRRRILCFGDGATTSGRATPNGSSISSTAMCMRGFCAAWSGAEGSARLGRSSGVMPGLSEWVCINCAEL